MKIVDMRISRSDSVLIKDGHDAFLGQVQKEGDEVGDCR